MNIQLDVLAFYPGVDGGNGGLEAVNDCLADGILQTALDGAAEIPCAVNRGVGFLHQCLAHLLVPAQVQAPSGQALVEEAYSTVYGARNLRRTIQRRLEDPISEAIIDSFETPISSIHARMEGKDVKLDIH